MTTNIITAVITAYCACTTCCGPNAKGITAIGRVPAQGRTIAASRSIPLGSNILINGKRYIVEDRLAKRFDKRFDIYFTKHSDARKFGIRTNTVTIITIK